MKNLFLIAGKGITCEKKKQNSKGSFYNQVQKKGS